MEQRPSKRRIRPLDAWRAIRVLIQNPDDTGQVFRIIDALSGNSGERLFQRFRRDPMGARILGERRSLLTTLSDRAALKALPAGSLEITQDSPGLIEIRLTWTPPGEETRNYRTAAAVRS